MSFSQDVLKYVLASDKPLTSADIAKAFPGRTNAQAAVALGDHWRAGRLNRERKRVKGHPKLVIYGYFAPAKEVKAEPLAAVPPKAAPVIPPPAPTPAPDFALVLADLVTSIADRLATEIVSQVRVKLESEVARQLAEITLPHRSSSRRRRRPSLSSALSACCRRRRKFCARSSTTSLPCASGTTARAAATAS